MKKIIFLLFLLLLIPINVFAVNYNTSVGDDLTYEECTNFQDSVVSSATSGYFGHCAQETCYSGVWETRLFGNYKTASDFIKCANGNQNFYFHVVSTGCSNYVGSCTVSSRVHYCTSISNYDCDRKSDGSAYITPNTTTTTTTTKRVQKPNKTTTTTTTTTTATKDCNNYLASLEIDPGKITFDKLTQSYTITVPDTTKTIKVNAKAESSLASIALENNDNIDFSKPLKITVTSACGDTRIYLINIKTMVTLDNDNLLSNITIKGYKINFEPEEFTYNVKVGKDVKSLTITATTKSSKATYKITGNSNLKNNSKIKINVTAEDKSTETYIINIKKPSNIGKIIIIILIIGIIIFVLYKLIRMVINKRNDHNYDGGNGEYEYE